MLFVVVPYVYCASFHRYQQVQERCSSAAQVEHILNHSDGGQEMELDHYHLCKLPREVVRPHANRSKFNVYSADLFFNSDVPRVTPSVINKHCQTFSYRSLPSCFLAAIESHPD